MTALTSQAGVSRLLCLRHAESENATGQRQAGALPSAPLTPKGKEQASATATELRAGDTRLIKAVYASDALRAQQTAEGSTDPAIHRHTAEVLKSWIVDGDLSARMADGESGNDVAVRMTSALTQIAADCVGATAIVIGHVASLTVGVSELCRNGPALWGQPLPHATVFPLIREEANWHVNWPGWDQSAAW